METVIKTATSVVLTDKMVEAVMDYSNGKTIKQIAAKHKKSNRTIEGWFGSMKSSYKCKHITHLACHFLRTGIIK